MTVDLMSQKGLRELEAQCIQDSAPPCNAACPLHVDARAMLTALSLGDISAARDYYTKTVPFPGILSRICDEPCRAVCTRGNVGQPLAIRALEEVCMSPAVVGEPRPKHGPTRPSRDKRVAVVGGGLSGLTVAFDLARKGIDVTVYEARDRLGGRIWDTPEHRLPPDVVAADLAVLDALAVTILLETTIVESEIEDLCQDYDAVYLATTAYRLAVDTFTFAADRPGLFARDVRPSEPWSPVRAMSDGRRAAISIDRHLQKVSLSAAREKEGAYETKLYTNTAGVQPLDVTPLPTGSNGVAPKSWAVTEAGRCLQCQCLECVKVCEYLEAYGAYPRQYVRTIYNNLSIVMGERHANQFINSCATCGLCAAVCPTDLDMGAVCKAARGIMVQQRRMPPSAHDFALRDMAFSNSDKFALARHRPGAAGSDYLFFPGCQLAGSSPAHVTAVFDYLQDTLPGNVGLMLGCCGAPADWAGREDLRSEALGQFQANHQALGRPKVILACSSCFQLFSAQLPQVELLSLWTVLDEYGLPPAAASAKSPATVAIHDPCTTRDQPDVQGSVRRLMARLGYQVDELPRSGERTTCCGFGGLMVFANRELARKVVQRRIEESADDYVTYCAVCRDFLAGQGKPTRHLLDLIFGAENGGGRGPGFSQKHENRARLKRQLLQQRWGETVTGQEAYEGIQLYLSDEVQALLEERLILVEDVQQVIAHAQQSEQRLQNPQSGHFLAHFRPNTVTYWVEYAPEGSGYRVYNAYSHRMEVGR